MIDQTSWRKVIREIAHLRRQLRRTPRLRQGVVTGTDAGGIVHVRIAGDDDPTEMHTLAAVATGDTVWLIAQDGILLCLGDVL